MTFAPLNRTIANLSFDFCSCAEASSLQSGQAVSIPVSSREYPLLFTAGENYFRG
jgi:hypothetical protein